MYYKSLKTGTLYQLFLEEPKALVIVEVIEETGQPTQPQILAIAKERDSDGYHEQLFNLDPDKFLALDIIGCKPLVSQVFH